jgi:hypothetical protein
MIKHSVPIEILELQDGDYHLFLTAYAGRNKLRLLIDTGASKTILSKAFCKKVKTLKLIQSEHTAAGLGTADMQSWFTEIKTFRLGNFQIKNYTCGVLDLSHVTELYRQLHLPDFDGVLGCDILVSHSISIDLKRKLLIIPKLNM